MHASNLVKKYIQGQLVCIAAAFIRSNKVGLSDFATDYEIKQTALNRSVQVKLECKWIKGEL